jgi:signal transduction histidine kinase
MGNGGKITLETTRLDSKVLIAFHDTGAGIPAHLLHKIGNPFYTTKEKGTGLGLMISKSIIESHEGELRINSIEGKGTTVEVILPVCE